MASRARGSELIVPQAGFIEGDRECKSIKNLKSRLGSPRKCIFQGESVQCYLVVDHAAMGELTYLAPVAESDGCKGNARGTGGEQDASRAGGATKNESKEEKTETKASKVREREVEASSSRPYVVIAHFLCALDASSGPLLPMGSSRGSPPTVDTFYLQNGDLVVAVAIRVDFESQKSVQLVVKLAPRADNVGTGVTDITRDAAGLKSFVRRFIRQSQFVNSRRVEETAELSVVSPLSVRASWRDARPSPLLTVRVKNTRSGVDIKISNFNIFINRAVSASKKTAPLAALSSPASIESYFRLTTSTQWPLTLRGLEEHVIIIQLDPIPVSGRENNSSGLRSDPFTLLRGGGLCAFSWSTPGPHGGAKQRLVSRHAIGFGAAGVGMGDRGMKITVSIAKPSVFVMDRFFIRLQVAAGCAAEQRRLTLRAASGDVKTDPGLICLQSSVDIGTIKPG